jgi:hypothetical protein
MASGAPDDTIIKGSWLVDEADTILDGFTLDLDVTVTADDFVLQDCLVDGMVDLAGGATDAMIHDNTFDVGSGTGVIAGEDDAAITGNTFNVGSGGEGVVNLAGGIDTTVTDNMFVGSSGTGVLVDDGKATIEDNTFDGLDIAIDVDGGMAHVKWNSILDSDDYGVDAEVDVDATFNWWGTAVSADIAAMLDGNVNYIPFLSGLASDVISAHAYDASGTATSLTAASTVGVNVVDTTTAAEIIVVAEYASNPGEALADAVWFGDIYVC